MDYSRLPLINTGLNAATTVLLLLGWWRIHRRDETGHKRCMLLAAACSALFLIGYVIYHAKVGSVRYTGQGPLRPVYFFILITHVVLAAVNVPLVTLTLISGLRDRRERHRRLAHWTFPIWLYVSVTGVVVYLMLYGWPFGGES